MAPASCITKNGHKESTPPKSPTISAELAAKIEVAEAEPLLLLSLLRDELEPRNSSKTLKSWKVSKEAALIIIGDKLRDAILALMGENSDLHDKLDSQSSSFSPATPSTPTPARTGSILPVFTPTTTRISSTGMIELAIINDLQRKIMTGIEKVLTKIDALGKTMYASVVQSSPTKTYQAPQSQPAAPPISIQDTWKKIITAHTLTIKISRVDKAHRVHTCEPDIIVKDIIAAMNKVPELGNIEAKSVLRLKSSDICVTFRDANEVDLARRYA
ncbi:hypothetical protein C8J56DRAFT_1061943 [Mycena floridula]|nr:hypothetical protein C8J56DRAFT_1061943 [Mycena floridula]